MDEIITISDEQYLRIITSIRTARNIDIASYQPIITKHRFARAARAYGFKDISSMINRLITDKVFMDMLLKEIKASTTEMFRDPQTWLELENILREKFKQEVMIKIWVPDVCGDDELHSILALLSKTGMLNKTMIYATSAYPHCLEICQKGFIDSKKYEISETNFKKMDEQNKIEEYVKPCDKGYRFAPELLSKVIFLNQSVVMDNPPDKGMGLILFRNRSLYYSTPAKKRLLDHLTNSLIPGGYLVMGIGENMNGLDAATQYTQVSKTEKIFRKK